MIEPIFKGNKVQMNAYVMRKLAQTITKESISTGDDLSGTTISLTLARLMLFSETNIMESKNYKIVDKTDTEEDGTQIETIALRTSDNLLVDILFQYDGTHHVLLKNTEEYVLPDDFGIVTYTYETRFENLDYYIKKVVEKGLEVLETPVIEQLTYQPIVLFSSYNKISTNYENAILNLSYPKNVDFIKYFLISSFSYNLNNEDKFLTLDDIYFKNCFTEIDEQAINAEFNKLTIKCLNSTNSNFNLDCDGNLTVNSITTKVQDETSSSINFDKIYPVGSIYLSVNSTNPSTLFGGSWEAFAAGKTLVGVDVNQEEFNEVQKTGGEKKHTLTLAEIPSHQHTMKFSGNWLNGVKGDQSRAAYDVGIGNWGVTVQYSEGEGNYAGGGESHNNLQPYITIYMWKRVA